MNVFQKMCHGCGFAFSRKSHSCPRCAPKIGAPGVETAADAYGALDRGLMLTDALSEYGKSCEPGLPGLYLMDGDEAAEAGPVVTEITALKARILELETQLEARPFYTPTANLCDALMGLEVSPQHTYCAELRVRRRMHVTAFYLLGEGLVLKSFRNGCTSLMDGTFPIPRGGLVHTFETPFRAEPAWGPRIEVFNPTDRAISLAGTLFGNM